jgi:predicted amidophosphoribosyltransferase
MTTNCPKCQKPLTEIGYASFEQRRQMVCKHCVLYFSIHHPTERIQEPPLAVTPGDSFISEETVQGLLKWR